MALTVRQPTIPDKKRYATEGQMQADCTQWFWNTYPALRRLLHHNDNNSEDEYAGSTKKALGVVRGVSDLEYVADNGITFYIELKLPGKTQSEEQIDFMNKLISRKHIYMIIYSFEDFKVLIKQIL